VSKPRTFNRDLVYPVHKNAEGRRLCRWCQSPVPRSRMSYCSKACLKEVDIRTSAGMLRYHVKQRDQGVCAACGLDTQRLKRILDHARRSLYELLRGIGSTDGCWFPYEARAVDSVLRQMGFNSDKTLWEADHIIEVSAGGDSNLANVQTLCVPCHKAKTKKMHADRKFERTGIRPKQPTKETQLRMI
jgi:5-methylcytosine-specific restriction enzyme A